MADFFQNVCAAAKIRPNDPDEDLAFAVKADLSTRRSPAVSASAQPTFAGTRCLPIEDYFHRIPLVPWICPPLHPELLRLLENIGQESVLAPGAQIYREGEPVSRFAVVKKGLVARKLGTYGAKSDNQIGLARRRLGRRRQSPARHHSMPPRGREVRQDRRLCGRRGGEVRAPRARGKGGECQCRAGAGFHETHRRHHPEGDGVTPTASLRRRGWRRS